MKTIDLNADLGEGFPGDLALMGIITSANICGGAYASTPEIIQRTVITAQTLGIATGAHPGYPDPANFGRASFAASMAAVLASITAQLQLLKSLHAPLRYLKLHGALYNQAMTDASLATAVVLLAKDWALPMLGLPGSALEAAANLHAVKFYREGFADRRYTAAGQLVPRTQADAMIHDWGEAVEQVQRLIAQSQIQSVCVHGDNPQAIEFATSLRQSLQQAGFRIQAFVD
jgi:5-oxoprolinase (ATP-hydrolysing) subunit A